MTETITCPVCTELIAAIFRAAQNDDLRKELAMKRQLEQHKQRCHQEHVVVWRDGRVWSVQEH